LRKRSARAIQNKTENDGHFARITGRLSMKKRNATVVLADTGTDLANAVRRCFEPFGGAGALIKSSGDVYLKVNAVDLKPHCYTDPAVIRETVLLFTAAGARRIYVIENCTQSNFTRMVFAATGIRAVCDETGAVPVCLDETGATPVFLNTTEQFADISSFVHERLVERRDENLYVSIPKLKTHSMTSVTLSIKNQFGFVHQASRVADHNYRLHMRLADLYRILRPDFALVDGIIATTNGHYIAEGNAGRSVVPMGLLVAGSDPLAVDAVAAGLMGYSVDDVEHLRLCRKTGIGTGDLRRIDIINKRLYAERKKKLTHELLDDFPKDLVILRGKERCCAEGCRRNTETVAEVFHRDHGGRGGFTIIMGKGIPHEQVNAIAGPVHIAGGCAIEEHAHALIARLGKKKVTMSPGCNNLPDTVYALCRHMRVSPLRLVPVNPLSSLALLAGAKASGSRAVIPKLL